MPILEEKPVWGTNDDTRTAYLDTVDISRMVMAAIRAPGASNASLTLAGPKAWTTSEVRPVPCAACCVLRSCLGAPGRPRAPRLSLAELRTDSGNKCARICAPPPCAHGVRYKA